MPTSSAQGDAKIGQDRPVALVKQNVARLDVAVYQATLVGEVQGVGHGQHDLDRLLRIGTLFLEPRFQVAAVQVLGDDEAQTVVTLADVVDRDDARMIEPRQGAGLLLKGGHLARGGKQARMNHFHGHDALEFLVEREVNLGRGADPQAVSQLITPQSRRHFQRRGLPSHGFRFFLRRAHHRVSCSLSDF